MRYRYGHGTCTILLIEVAKKVSTLKHKSKIPYKKPRLKSMEHGVYVHVHVHIPHTCIQRNEHGLVQGKVPTQCERRKSHSSVFYLHCRSSNMYMYTCMYVQTYLLLRFGLFKVIQKLCINYIISISTCMYMYIHTCMYLHVRSYMYVHTCTVYTCTYMYQKPEK